jgi:hypothetical protein
MLLDAYSHPLRFGKHRLVLNLSFSLSVSSELKLGLDDLNPSADFVPLVEGHVILSVEILYILYGHLR